MSLIEQRAEQCHTTRTQNRMLAEQRVEGNSAWTREKVRMAGKIRVQGQVITIKQFRLDVI